MRPPAVPTDQLVKYLWRLGTESDDARLRAAAVQLESAAACAEARLNKIHRMAGRRLRENRG